MSSRHERRRALREARHREKHPHAPETVRTAAAMTPEERDAYWLQELAEARQRAEAEGGRPLTESEFASLRRRQMRLAAASLAAMAALAGAGRR